MTENAARKDQESGETGRADVMDFLDPSDSCDFGYTIIRAPRREETAGAKVQSEYAKS